jgi:alpha-D-xyloside xylohydrolase
MREFDELLTNLKPYIQKSPLPVIRSMAEVFSEDLTCPHLGNQYMLGESILVAKRSHEEIYDKFYLPSGLWTDYYTGKEYKGGGWVNRAANSDTLVMIRENSILETTTHDNCYELRAYAIHNGIVVFADVYGNNGELVLGVTLKRIGRSIHVTSDGSLPYSIRMVNMKAKTSVNGFITIEGNDSIITPDRGAEMIEIKF